MVSNIVSSASCAALQLSSIISKRDFISRTVIIPQPSFGLTLFLVLVGVNLTGDACVNFVYLFTTT